MSDHCKRTERPQDPVLRRSTLHANVINVLLTLGMVLLVYSGYKLGPPGLFPPLLLMFGFFYVVNARFQKPLELGMKALTQQRYDEAEAHFYEAAKRTRWLVKTHPNVLGNLAFIAMRKGQWDKALSLMSASWEYEFQFSPDMRCLMAANFADAWSFAGDTDAARCWLEVAKRDEDRGYPILVQHSEILLQTRLGHYEEALTLCAAAEQQPIPNEAGILTTAWKNFALHQLGRESTPPLDIDVSTASFYKDSWPAYYSYLMGESSQPTPETGRDEATHQNDEKTPLKVITIKPNQPKQERYGGYWLLASIAALLLGLYVATSHHRKYKLVDVDDTAFVGLMTGLGLGALWMVIVHFRSRPLQLRWIEYVSFLATKGFIGLLGFFVLGASLPSVLNGAMDKSPAVKHKVKVLKKRLYRSSIMAQSGGPHCWVKFQYPLDSKRTVLHVFSGRVALQLLRGGSTLVFTTHKGALGYPWYTHIQVE
ncbi:MAG: hypothetical protein EP343_26595 [Deltaproteobacteria bacterium]|nr:MAG: hypothetical protein EP343_26595 [Deltaproteobacteria bacterium]